MNDVPLRSAQTSEPGSALDLSTVRTIDGVDVNNKHVLLRVDFNVPIKDGMVADATRIKRVLPTISKLARGGAKVIVLSHLGRPKGVRAPETSLRPVAAKMQELMPGTTVRFFEDCVGDEVARGVDALKPGEVAVLENLRYHNGEEKNDVSFARSLAGFGDLYVNDAFSSAHRSNASIDAITDLIPSYAGLLMMAEITALGQALEHPNRPVMAVIGGVKVSTKIEVLKNLATKVDQLVIGGGMANPFLRAKGVVAGKSFSETDLETTVREILARAERSSCEVVLPKDVVVTKELTERADWQVYPFGNVPEDAMIVDIGPDTIADLKQRLGTVRTVLWNGPLGAFETPPFGEGTFTIAREVGRLTTTGKVVSVAGGGDTVRALNESKVAADFTYISTAGGAFLEWLGGHELPAVLALSRSGARHKSGALEMGQD